jgi:hypothetical protein
MKTSRLSKILSLGIASLLTQACSHPIEIEGQGDVMSASGNRTCLLENFQAGDVVCSKNYAVGAYQETYYATAKPGWKFDHWVTYCANATPPNYDCSFNIPAEAVRDFWGKAVPPLKAVFTPIPGAITDTITVNGVEWAQPDLFTNLSWGEINQLCPIAEGGVCKKAVYEEDRLNGYDMEGWTWASMDDVNGLFNYFLASAGVTGDDLLSGQDYYYGYDYGGWGTAFFDAGFRGTFGPRFLDGLVSTLHDCCQAYVGRMQDFDDPEPDVAQVFFYESSRQPDVGAFFYRSAP